MRAACAANAVRRSTSSKRLRRSKSSMDVPGLPASAIRVLMRRNVLMVVGAKAPAAGERPSRVHVAERNYGRFARTVRVDAAVDATRATASLRLGQLRIVLPRLDRSRGLSISIPVEAAAVIKLAFVGDIVGRPGAGTHAAGTGGDRRPARHRSGDRQRGERGRRVRPHAGHRRRSLRVRRPRDDGRQSHVGQERNHSLSGRPSARAPAGQFSGRRAGRRPLRGAHGRRACPLASSTSWAACS